MPKTIDNDVYPIKQSLGAWTAAEQGAIFFENVVNESSANPRMVRRPTYLLDPGPLALLATLTRAGSLARR